MIRRVGQLKGRVPHLVEVPLLTPWLSALWIELVTPARADVARPLIEGLRNPTIAKDERIRSLVPIELTPFNEAARAALAEAGFITAKLPIRLASDEAANDSTTGPLQEARAGFEPAYRALQALA